VASAVLPSDRGKSLDGRLGICYRPVTIRAPTRGDGHGGLELDVAADPIAKETSLANRALAILDANWLGSGTSPSRRLYPHQWSWDAACIAMGQASWNQGRADTELRSLFAGQWRNGLLPHIVFTDGARYFPGPEFWQAERSLDAPKVPQTSGIVQPPIHATAVLEVYRRGPDRSRARVLLEDLQPKLAAWHGYLYRERTREDSELVEIWHPWESGMDNSPLWDDALGRISLVPEQIPEYRRVDVDVADAAERPTDEEYDRYTYLVGLYRELYYDPAAIRDATPFALRPALFNALLVQGDLDLAEISGIVGRPSDEYRERASKTASEIDTTLWDDEGAVYADVDVRTGGFVPARSAAGLAPLLAGVPDGARAARVVERLADSRVAVGEDFAVTSQAPAEPGFQPTRYWRGPIWPILNWVLQRGLDRYGYTAHAGQVRRAMLDLADRSGFWEHYSPVTGRGHGGADFAWTAGLTLDLLRSESDRKGTHMDGARANVGDAATGTATNERRDSDG
jgi:mannosylglycerate hydrolase